MNIYIMVDAEGISGIYSREQASLDGSRYDECRKLITWDINTCVEAAKEAGAEKIIVRDAHGAGRNVIWEELSSKVDYYVVGNGPGNRMPGIEECDGVILLGYHAMAGTYNGVLEHTFDSKTVQNYWLNGEKAGEIAIDAAIAGDFGKPVIMVSGDDKACLEAKTLLPWIVTAEVKKGLGCFYSMLLPREKSRVVLSEKTKEAIANFSNTKPYVPEKPIKLRIELCERCQLPNPGKPYMTIIDGRTFEVESSTMEEAINRRH